MAADVAGVQPSVLDGLGRRLGLVVVAGHQVRAARENLAVGGDAQLDTGDCLADRSGAGRRRRIDGEDRCGLREAVALDDRQAQAVKELGHGDAERRASRHQVAKTAADAVADFREHQAVGERRLQREERRRTPPREQRTAARHADVDGPAEDRALRRRSGLPRLRDPGVHLLVDARHAGEHRRLHHGHVAADGLSQLNGRRSTVTPRSR